MAFADFHFGTMHTQKYFIIPKHPGNNPVNQKDLATLWDKSHIRKGTHFLYCEGIFPFLEWDISRDILCFFNSVVSIVLSKHMVSTHYSHADISCQ